MMHGFGYGFGSLGTYGWVGMILNLLVTVGLIVGVVLLVIWLVRRIAPEGGGAGDSFIQSRSWQSPREILQTRYARGEITRDQYFEMLEDLG